MHIEQRKYRDALRLLLEEQDFRYHLTFTFCRDLSYQAAKDKLRYWTCRVLRRLYGRNHFRRDPMAMLFYVAFPEYGAAGDNLHLHALARVDDDPAGRFVNVGRREWQAVVPSGNLFVQVIGESRQDQMAVISYATKALSSDKEFIISTEFASTSRRQTGDEAHGTAVGANR